MFIHCTFPCSSKPPTGKQGRQRKQYSSLCIIWFTMGSKIYMQEHTKRAGKSINHVLLISVSTDMSYASKQMSAQPRFFPKRNTDRWNYIRNTLIMRAVPKTVLWSVKATFTSNPYLSRFHTSWNTAIIYPLYSQYLFKTQVWFPTLKCPEST